MHGVVFHIGSDISGTCNSYIYIATGNNSAQHLSIHQFDKVYEVCRDCKGTRLSGVTKPCERAEAEATQP